jgi:hypothetical protein
VILSLKLSTLRRSDQHLQRLRPPPRASGPRPRECRADASRHRQVGVGAPRGRCRAPEAAPELAPPPKVSELGRFLPRVRGRPADRRSRCRDGQPLSFSASSVWGVSTRFRPQVGMDPRSEPSFGTPHGRRQGLRSARRKEALFLRKEGALSGHGAAQESNLPSRGLHDLTGFEGWRTRGDCDRRPHGYVSVGRPRCAETCSGQYKDQYKAREGDPRESSPKPSPEPGPLVASKTTPASATAQSSS